MARPTSPFPQFFSASDLVPMHRLVDKVFERITQHPLTGVEMRIDDHQTAIFATEVDRQAAATASKN
ncbi:hypothetical protein HFO56_22975 [Rhizobium laguerreae]|uniref:hypothetical protein n=1 Tax=Rhizobium laguerreae TaxID=1076926 RepID=UPI001C920A03|nr:hypothetical protein [Rhizobium laguerreae]MBY3155188.1 hypothetical protein [Rhizobium laguerreae]